MGLANDGQCPASDQRVGCALPSQKGPDLGLLSHLQRLAQLDPEARLTSRPLRPSSSSTSARSGSAAHPGRWARTARAIGPGRPHRGDHVLPRRSQYRNVDPPVIAFRHRSCRADTVPGHWPSPRRAVQHPARRSRFRACAATATAACCQLFHECNGSLRAKRWIGQSLRLADRDPQRVARSGLMLLATTISYWVAHMQVVPSSSHVRRCASTEITLG